MTTETGIAAILNMATDLDLTEHAALSTGIHGVGASEIASKSDVNLHAALSTGIHGVGASEIASKSDVNLLSALSPTVSGDWDTQPATAAQMSNENVDELLTTAGYQTSSGEKVGYVTYNLGSIKRVIIMVGVLPTNSVASYQVSRDNVSWHSFGSTTAGSFVISSIAGAWQYIRVTCTNQQNTTSYTKIKMSAYTLP